MIRKEYVFVAILTVAGAAAGYWLLPEDADVARMEVRDFNYSDPKTHYEKQFEGGDHSVEVVQQLVRIHTNTGDVDRAIEVLETYVKEYPEDEKALQQLGELYQFAQRYEDYMAILEARAAEKETPVVLKEMAELYNFFQQQEKQKEVLARLQLLEQGQNPETLHELALFAAVDKDYDQVAKWLNQLYAEHPEAYDEEDAIRHVNALLELDRPEGALDAAKKWKALPQAEAEHVAPLVDMLHYQGGREYAHNLLDSYSESEVRKSPELLHSWLLLLLAEGKKDEAYEVLQALYEKGNLPDSLMPDLMYMAAVDGKEEQFNELYTRTGLTRLTEMQLVEIWMVASDTNQRPVLKTIRNFVNESEQEYTVMDALITTHDHSPARHNMMKALLEEDLNNFYVLNLAMAAAKSGDHGYARGFLAKLPETDELGVNELAELERVYLALGDISAAKQFVASLKAGNRMDSLGEIGLRTAAAVGDAKVLRDWHLRHGKDASASLLDDLFYQAANHRNLRLALEISNWQHDPRSKALARRSIADIYTRLGRYSDALSLLEKTPPKTESEVKDRVFLLSKLAPSSALYRKRLQRLAQKWFTPSASRSLKEQLVFALLDSSDASLAAPYMKKMADQYGGEWLLTYGDVMMQIGEKEEATTYYLKAADDASFDEQTKLGLAYALADQGQSEAAQKLLIALAENPKTRVPATEQLVYIWGVHPTEQQLDWLVARWQAAGGEERAAYGKLLDGRIPPHMLVEYVGKNPSVRARKQVNEAYLLALSQKGLLAGEIANEVARAKETGNVRQLNALGTLARDAGKLKHARMAYDAAHAISPRDVPTLIGATITADAQGDYPSLVYYFEQYLALNGNTAPKRTPSTPTIYEAYFAYAEYLRRQQRPEEAVVYYEHAFNTIRGDELRDARSLSIAAQSAAWMQELEASDMIYDYAYARHPENKVIRADKAALMIEQKQYDIALEELNHLAPSAGGNMPQDLGEFMLSSADTGSSVKPKVMDNGQQLLVRTAPESAAPRYWLSGARGDENVSYITEGYDTVLVVAKPGRRFVVNEPRAGWMVKIQPEMDIPSDTRSEAAQLALRRELLKARIELETGELEAATKRMEALEDIYYNDPQFLGFAANAYFYADSWTSAKDRIKQAEKIAPDNADIAKLKRNIDRDYADRVRLDVTQINRGDNTELVTELSAQSQVSESWHVGGVVRNHDVEVESRLQPDGTISGNSGDRQTVELYGIYTHNPRHRTKLHLFANNDTLGLGADHHYLNALGISEFGLRWHEPYFEFVEGIFDNVVRDRIYARHTVKPNPDWQWMLGTSLNNYSLESEDDVFSSWGVEASVSYALQQSGPYIGLGYGLDAEYQIDNSFQQTAGGALYRQLPLRSREIHFVSVTAAEDFSERTYGSVLAGYGWDRLGGHGPSVEGRINHNIYKDWDVGARALYGLDSTASAGDDLSILNAYIQYRF